MCTDSCHYVLTNPDDPTYAPAYKADQIRKIFKRHFDWTGRVFPWWVGAKSVYTDEDLEELKDIVFGKCTNCRRCSINCPMGVDFAVVNRMARGLLVSVGVMPEGVAVVSKDQWEIGNQMGVLKEDYLETLEWMSEELRRRARTTRRPAIPIDKTDADVVYTINPREVKYDPRTIADAAKIFYLAGENWTMPSEGWDMTNFGLFSGDDDLGGAVARRLYEKVVELRRQEAGHLRVRPRLPLHPLRGPELGRRWTSPSRWRARSSPCCATSRRAGSRSTRRKNTIPVTFHDSCNNARSCGLFEEPRELLNLVVTDFREMYPNRAENYCCTGGGGAMSMSEYTPRRLKSAKVKAEQLDGHRREDRRHLLPQLRGRPDRPASSTTSSTCRSRSWSTWSPNALVVPEQRSRSRPRSSRAGGAAALEPGRPQDPGRRRRAGRPDLPRRGPARTTARRCSRPPTATTALAIARREKPDLITLDLSMPGKDGGEVFEALRQRSRARGDQGLHHHRQARAAPADLRPRRCRRPRATWTSRSTRRRCC